MANDWKSKYDYASDFSEGLAVVTCEGEWGFVDKKGKEVIPLKYYGVEDFSEGLAAVNRWASGWWRIEYVDKKGNLHWDTVEDEAREQKL